MRLLTLVLVPAALLASQSRFARLGEFQGQVEVQLTAADPWIPAERNLPLIESAWLRTGAGARVEIEMDDGSMWRLGADSLGEISDYTRLSTGQRITLLSLDHGTAYYTGQPATKDVTMLVMPGAQLTVLQGSRVRQTVQPGWSHAAVLEGAVRFSSPAAEMDVREGTTARVDPANASRFSLEPQVAIEVLDNWSEGRDKAQNSPASSAYVNAAFGLADLDAAGKWTPVGNLGMVWKPDVADGWTPYRNGRWRYYESLGYTWVSDDSWGWLPYHNGRWARVEKVGWVWQPAVNPVFHPGDVYWLRGATFTGWGPLAPGEQWNEPNPGSVTPQGYIAGSTTFAAFRPDLRLVSGAGFDAPTSEQMKTAIFIPALPSPAFLTARLDAVRPQIQVGSTRVVPSVTGVTFGDAPAPPPSDVMTTPAYDPPPTPTVSDVGMTPPPDGVYPVPPIAIPVVEVPVGIYPPPPEHPTYSPRRGGNQPAQSNPVAPSPVAPNGSKPTPSYNPPGLTGPKSAQTTNPPAPPTPTTGTGGHPVHPAAPPPAAAPASPPSRPAGEPLQQRPVMAPKPAPPVTPKTDDTKKVAALGELDFHRLVLQDIDPKQPDFNSALSHLEAWSHKYPASTFANDRLYYYIHVYNGIARPELVMDTAAPLVKAGVKGSYRDAQQVLQILVAVSASAAKLRTPTAEQLATGQRAARELLEFLPEYFSPRRKPANVSDSAWSAACAQLEDIGRQALAHSKVQVAAAK